MKVGILGAMPEEVSCIEKLMTVFSRKKVGSRTYIEGAISNIDIVLTFSRWGKVASACTTTTLINLFNVDFILFTGVAGAVLSDLNIGDIIISEGLYQHDMDARPIFEQFQIPLTETKLFTPSTQDISIAVKASRQFASTINETFTKETLSSYSIEDPHIYKGVIASGDKFITNPSAHAELNYSADKLQTLAVEMEGAAVAQVCTDYNVPYVIIRTISDKANHSAAIDFQSFINEIASKYSAGIVMKFIEILAEKKLYHLLFSSGVDEINSSNLSTNI